MGHLANTIAGGTQELKAFTGELNRVRQEAEAIVGLQERGARALPAAGDPFATVGRSEGGGGGGGFAGGSNAGVIGLLLGAIQQLGTGNQPGPPGFQPGPPTLRGATFARSLALGQFR